MERWQQFYCDVITRDDVTTFYAVRRWSEAVERWQQFHCDMKEIGSWLTNAEERLQGTVDNDGVLNEASAKDLQQVSTHSYNDHGVICHAKTC